MNAFQKQLLTREFTEQMGTDRKVVFDDKPDVMQPAMWVLTGERDEPGEDRFFVTTLQVKEALPVDQLASDFGWFLNGRGAPAGHATNAMNGATIYVGTDMERITAHAKAHQAMKAEG